ncbi:hypothetical protein AA0229_2614 [Gluconobacter cerinus NRIC 0229]|uniref:Uncharacterized protein n=1 Tax=Gluconobacter cerinus TaxID=38307 RepID=A0AAV5NFK1_9PROT|nr:hypothetical protein AA0229_2614 [Gluconobacter cerinus NRIC 0229]GLQ62758.1 hypothetical protein GCM10007867_16030 [Gluconobacter cerinus]
MQAMTGTFGRGGRGGGSLGGQGFNPGLAISGTHIRAAGSGVKPTLTEERSNMRLDRHLRLA